MHDAQDHHFVTTCRIDNNVRWQRERSHMFSEILTVDSQHLVIGQMLESSQKQEMSLTGNLLAPFG